MRVVSVVSVLVDAAAEAVVLEERLEELSVVVVLSSSSSQSVGKSTVPLALFTATPPVAPVASMRARAVFLVVHKTFLFVALDSEQFIKVELNLQHPPVSWKEGRSKSLTCHKPSVAKWSWRRSRWNL